MIKKLAVILFILLPCKAYGLIKVDITRGNLDPLPLAVSPLALDDKLKNRFQKILNKKNMILIKLLMRQKNIFQIAL